MNLGLSGKSAWVTGASSGIGAETAALLAEEGCDVVVGYGHNEEGAREVLHRIRACGKNAVLSRFDLSTCKGIGAEVERVLGEIGELDILIVNAGHNEIGTFEATTLDSWHRVMAINLDSAFCLTQALQNHLRPGGSVVTVASVAAHTGAPHHAHYAAAKAGLVNLTKTLARLLAPDIRANCVAPGMTLTEMGRETLDALSDDYARRSLLLQRFAEPEEIARCIVFVASPAAGFMTGATLDVNGGRVLR